MEAWFGTAHRSVLTVASLLLPAGFSFGFSLGTPEGAYAFTILAPFVSPGGETSFADPEQARTSAERELIRAFVRPVIASGQLGARSVIITESIDRSNVLLRIEFSLPGVAPKASIDSPQSLGSANSAMSCRRSIDRFCVVKSRKLKESMISSAGPRIRI